MSTRINPADLLSATPPYLSSSVGYLFFPHNWEEGLDEQLSWKTDILTARDRTEQRLRLRRQPRRTWDLRLLVSGHGRRRLETWIGQRLVHYLVVPVWRDLQALRAPVSDGAWTIPVDTEHTEYASGSLVAVWDSWNHFEVRKVIDVADGNITIDAPLSESWPSGTQVAPCRFSLCAEPRSISRFTEEVAEFRLTVGTLFDPAFPVMVEPETYLDLPICPFTPSWQDPEESVGNLWAGLDPETGMYEFTVQAVEPTLGKEAHFLVIGRERIDTFLRFLHTLAGRLNPFWLAANDRGLEVIGAAAAGGAVLTIENIGYGDDLSRSASRAQIELILTNGTVIRRAIIDVTVAGNQEMLTLDAPLPVDVSTANCNRCAWLEQVRLDSDEITLKWVTPDCLECTLPISVLP